MSFVARMYARVAAVGEDARRTPGAVELRPPVVRVPASVVQQALSRQGAS